MVRRLRTLISASLVAAVAASVAPTVWAAPAQMAHDMPEKTARKGHAMGSTPYAQAVNAAMARMDRNMKAAPMNGNAAHDFVTMMIPHHQGAVEMAKALQASNTTDPLLTKMTADVVQSQEREISQMLQWLRDKGFAKDAETMQKMLQAK